MQTIAKRDQCVMELVKSVLRRPSAERRAWLESACKGDIELYREVLEIVDGEERMSSFLLHPMIGLTEFPRPFKPGQLVAERFEVIREIGEGGMGVVYEAFDRKRGLRIAIKAAKPGFYRLLSPELEGALAVRHSNVCRVNEIHTAQTDHGEIDFLTMELLEGETLAAALRARGKLSIRDALPIARQLCAGLAEAHRSGVIHGDLKSANIILCPQTGGPSRTVITDFGLAGAASTAGAIAGTPNYMAPELWRGEGSSRASDIYALGVILYQMTACPDLPADAPIPNPQALRALSSRWKNTISRCLAADPSERPANAYAVERLLEPMPRRSKIALSVPPLVLLLLVTSLLVPQVQFRVKEMLGLSPNVRLVVLPPRQDDSGVLAGGVLQDVSNRLSNWRTGERTVSVVSPADAQRASVLTAEQAQTAHATHALETSFHRDGQVLVVKAAVVDVATRVHLRDFSARYTPATLGALPDALTGVVTGALRLSGSASDPVSPAATVAFDRGLYLLQDDRDVAQAITQFQEAARLDPQSPRPLANLVTAEIEKFNQTRDAGILIQARKDLEAGQNLNFDSPRIHLVGGQLNEAEGQYEQARQEYLRACQLEPRNARALIGLANIYDKMNMPEQAVASFREAIAFDPEFYLPHDYLGFFYYFRGSYSEAVEEFRQTVRLAPGMTDAFTSLAAALKNLGSYTEAEQSLRASLHLRETYEALNNMGSLLLLERKDAEAIPYIERSAALNPHEYICQLNLADANRHLGRVEAAHAAYRKGMELALTELDQNPRQGLVRAMVGYFAARLGQRHRAADEIRQALQLEPGNNRVIFRAAMTYEILGMRQSALATLTEASGQLLGEMERDRDLAEFSQDPRFKEIEAEKTKGG